MPLSCFTVFSAFQTFSFSKRSLSMEIKGTDQIYHILQNLSNLEMAFLDYSDNNKDFVEYHTYIEYFNSYAIRNHNLSRFYFPIAITPELNLPKYITDIGTVPEKLNILPGYDYAMAKQFNFPGGAPHSCEYYSLFYIIEGKAEVTIKNSQFALFQGDFIFIPPHVQYMITSVPESICICFNLKCSFVTAQYSDIFHDDKRLTTFLMDSLNENNQMNYLIIRTNANEIIKDLALNCFAEYINQNKYANNIMKNCLSLIFTYVLRDENTQIESSIRVSQNDLQYQRIIDYLKQNYKFASLNSTAEYVHYTKQYVCKIVKEATGKTFNTVLIEIRLAIVCQYLENSDFSLEYISELCGFSVSSHLSRVFKEHYGMTPSAYRKAHNPH